MLSGVDKLVEVEIYIGQATTPAQEKDGHVSNDQKKKPSQESEHELKQVSIKLPKMTWSGCEASVANDWKAVAGVSPIETDLNTQICTLKLDVSVEVENFLDALAEKNSKILQ